MADNLSTLVGSFVPTTNIWDPNELYDVDVNSPQFKELLVRLYQNINLICLALNTKDSAYYDTMEFVNGQLFFSNPALNSSTDTVPELRQAFRMVVNFGALPNTGVTAVAHGITTTSSTLFTRIYATASDTAGRNYIPIPYASPTLVNNIELSVDAVNVTITTGSNRSNFNNCIVVLEYLQS
jgi:hypothetical protein